MTDFREEARQIVVTSMERTRWVRAFRDSLAEPGEYNLPDAVGRLILAVRQGDDEGAALELDHLLHAEAAAAVQATFEVLRERGYLALPDE